MRRFVVGDSACYEATAAGMLVRMMENREIDVIIGPPCGVSKCAFWYRKITYVRRTYDDCFVCSCGCCWRDCEVLQHAHVQLGGNVNDTGGHHTIQYARTSDQLIVAVSQYYCVFL